MEPAPDAAVKGAATAGGGAFGAASAAAGPLKTGSPLQARVYQLELLELAKKRNAIAFLDTGAGKTFVSVLLIRHRLAEQRRLAAVASAAAAAAAKQSAAAVQPAAHWAVEQQGLLGAGHPGWEGSPETPGCSGRAPSVIASQAQANIAEDSIVGLAADPAGAALPQHRVAVFLAPKVALVLQQAEVLRQHLGADRVAHFVGEMGCDLWEKERWRAAFASHDVLAMTPQILLNLLSHGIVQASTGLSQIHLLCFDEAHHAKARHPYNRIMQQFYHSQKALLAPRPHIFGMTAAPANVKQKETQEHMEARIRVLEANLDAKVVTVVNRASVEEVASPPKLRILAYPPTCWEGGEVEGLQRRLARARARLQCAGEHFEIRWLRSLQRQLGADGVAPSAQRITFDPLVPGVTAAKLDQLLSSVEHVLQTLGPYCAALSTAEVFATLVHQPPACTYAPMGRRKSGGNGSEAGSAALAGEVECIDAEEDAPAAEEKTRAMLASEEEAAQQEASLVEAMMLHGFELAEVESEQAAANSSVLDVLDGFAALFGQPPFLPDPGAVHGSTAASPSSWAVADGNGTGVAEVQPAGSAGAGEASKETTQLGDNGEAGENPAAHTAGFWTLLADVRSSVAAGQLLGAQPLLAIRQLLAAVQPMHLQHAVESQLPAAGASAAAAAAAAATVAAAWCVSEPGSGKSSAPAAALQGGNSLELGQQLQAATTLPGPPPPFPLVTPKLAALAGDLMQYRQPAAMAASGGSQAGGQGAWCGIVFITQRMAAWALHKLLRISAGFQDRAHPTDFPAISLPPGSLLPCTRGTFRTSPIMGLGLRVGDADFSSQEQSRILRRFRAGDLNLLISTSVAEEGIDVKSCQLVVRFDLPNSAQSFIQSRGRARMANSELVMMVQEDQDGEAQMVAHMVEYEQQLRQEVLLNIERLQAGELEDDDCGATAAELQAELARAPAYEVEATGAKVTLENAQLLLNSYVARLPSDEFTQLRPLYRTEHIGVTAHRTRVFLPSNSPLPWADGAMMTGRRAAIAAAALQACKELHQLGALNDYLLPAVLDEPRNRPCAPRTPREPKQRQAAGRRKLAEPDDLLANKEHAPLPPVVIEAPEPQLLKGSLRSLLGREKATLHCYRWKAVGAAAGQAGTGAGPEADPALQELLQSLQLLGLLLPQALPAGLPAFTLSAPTPPASAASPAAAAKAAELDAGGEPPHRGSSSGASIEVRLVPAGTVDLSKEQQLLLLGCSHALVAHMFARGRYYGASGKLVATESPAGQPVRASRAVAGSCAASDGLPAGSADAATPKAAGTARRAAAEEPLLQTPMPRAAQQDADMADAAAAGCPASAQTSRQDGGEEIPAAAKAKAESGSEDDAQAAAEAERLVRNAVHRVLLLHDGRGLPRSKRTRQSNPAGPLAAGAAAADEAGFLLVLLAALQDGREEAPEEGSRLDFGDGGSLDTIIDWPVVRGIASDASFEGTLLDWLRSHAAREGRSTVGLATGSGQADSQPDTSCLESSALSEELRGRVLVTTYNNSAYLFRSVAEGLGVHSTFERSEPVYAAAKRTKREQKPAAGVAQGAGAPAGASLPDPAPTAGTASGAATELEGGSQPTASDAIAKPAHQPAPSSRLPCTDAHPAPVSKAAALQPPVILPAAASAPSMAEPELSAPAEAAGAAAAAPPQPEVTTYASYYAERWGQTSLAPDQPLLLAARVSRQQLARGLDLRRPRKRSHALHLEAEEEVHLLPQLCIRHPVPTALWRPLGTLPALMWQLEGSLLADQLLEQLVPEGLPADKAPPLELVRSAVTARSALEASDLERLETLGDAFLKFAVSAQLFTAHRQYHEGQLTKRKELVVANIHLAEAAVRLGLDRRLRVLSFSVRNWASPEAVRKSSKVLADAMEALLGAFLVAGGHAAALAFMQHLGLLKGWQPPSASACIQPEGAGMLESDVTAIEATLGYTFKSKWLVDEALTHCSWPGSGARCYQRLEFLGDAVLDALVTTHFYTAFSGASPSQMHDMRSVAVNASRLALAAVKHGLHTHLRHQSPRLFSHITAFVQEWEDRLADALEGSQNAAEQGGSSAEASTAERDSTATATPGGAGPQAEAVRAAQEAVLARFAFGFQTVQAPKVLSDVVESLIGAVYVDSGGSLDTAWSVTQRLLSPLVTPSTLPVHPIRQLQELVQRCGVNPEYEELAREQGGSARVHVKVSAQGVLLGESAFQATNFRTGCRLAAEAAVKVWPERCHLVQAARESGRVAAVAATAATATAADGTQPIASD
ncbi:hypothetical protein ABPG77_001500 [Micractinium sp. CCAP 211/92]